MLFLGWLLSQGAQGPLRYPEKVEKETWEMVVETAVVTSEGVDNPLSVEEGEMEGSEEVVELLR